MQSPAMQSSNEIVARHLRIRGIVQGVGFRWSTVEEARRLGLGGWVRNCRDGSVEAVVCGPNEAVAAMIVWAGQGPQGARVDGIEVEESSERHEEFSQRPTI